MRNKKIDPNRQKIVFSKKRLALVIIFASLAALLIYFSVALDPKYKYIRQFCAFFGYVSIALDLYHIGRLFTKEIRQELYRRLSKAIFNVAEKLKAAVDKIRQKLGIKPKIRHRSADEVNIIIRDDRVRQKKQKPVTKKRFNSLTEDAERIRFMYVKYIEYKQKKKGNCHSYDTPLELERKVAENDTEHELFELYTPVRYAEKAYVTPEDVKKQYEYLSKKVRLK
ncbi:MAG: hypothetical protein IJA55_08870 [Clostridia bacterium]|nr:hypothetical protein [Clostridia bacterium]